MNKENKWLSRRVGMITASELGNITSASGKIIDGNIDFIRKLRWERRHGFAHHVSSRPMEIGNEQEPMIYEWLKANTDFPEIVYSKDSRLTEIPFWVSVDCPVGASPDAFLPDESIVFEFKTLVSDKQIEFFGDENTSYAEKKVAVLKDHGDQLLGQFISNSAVKEIWLVKYIYQDDDILEDTDSPLAPWRGIIFKFKREDYEESINEMKERITLFDAMASSDVNPSEFKKGSWAVKDGKLVKE